MKFENGNATEKKRGKSEAKSRVKQANLNATQRSRMRNKTMRALTNFYSNLCAPPLLDRASGVCSRMWRLFARANCSFAITAHEDCARALLRAPARAKRVPPITREREALHLTRASEFVISLKFAFVSCNSLEKLASNNNNDDEKLRK